MTYDDFFETFMVRNVPCLIRDLINDWPAMTELVSHQHEPNVAFFEGLKRAEIEVPVADCSSKYFNSQEKVCLSLQEYLSYWKDAKARQERMLYLKDWHFFKEFPHVNLYSTPSYFVSDWLNEYWASKSDDYRFLYLGPKGSWTPFHSDVFGSFSWSANVTGHKKWIFFPKDQEPKNVYDILEIIPEGDLTDFSSKTHDDLQYFEIQQGPGEVIFVPSGWYHQVTNLTDTLSINHNWFNGTNIGFVLEQLKAELVKVQAEISDCYEENNEEWRELCQKLLLASHGMNYSSFIQLLQLVSQARLAKSSDDKYIEYDLKQVQSVLLEMQKSCSQDLLECDTVIIEQELEKIQDHY